MICEHCHKPQNAFIKLLWALLLIFLIDLHKNHSIYTTSLLQDSQAAIFPYVNESEFTQWSQRCLANLHAAHLQAIRADPTVKDGLTDIKQLMNGHDGREEYPHDYIGFWDNVQNVTFSIVIQLREATDENAHIPSVWYPTYRTSVPVSDKRYFFGRGSPRLVPLDDPKGIPLVGYSYARRVNNVIATIVSERQPSQLRPLIQNFEPAVDACLMDGRGLPPHPCPRMAALPPKPAVPSPVLRAAPPLTIEVRGMPARGWLHIAMGEWEYDLVESKQDNQKNQRKKFNQIIMPSIEWFSNFRELHTLYTGFSDNPKKSFEKQQQSGLLLSGTRFRADGTERDIRVFIEINQDRRLSTRIERRLPALSNVILKPAWTPSAHGRPLYQFINHSDRAIREVSAGRNFGGIVESWRDGKWQYYAGNSPETKKTETQNNRLILKSGDQEFTEPRNQGPISFRPGRYRYLVKYTTTLDETNGEGIDLFEVSSEFQIGSSSDK